MQPRSPQSGCWADRAYALVDISDGRVASAKNPRKWPTLFDFRAALTDCKVRFGALSKAERIFDRGRDPRNLAAYRGKNIAQ
jgi:hypothetical protein